VTVLLLLVFSPSPRRPPPSARGYCGLRRSAWKWPRGTTQTPTRPRTSAGRSHKRYNQAPTGQERAAGKNDYFNRLSLRARHHRPAWAQGQV